MRVLLVNPEVRDCFWSRTESCFLSGKKALLPPLGLITLAALLPREWDFRVRDLSIEPLTEDDWSWADVVMVTGMIVHRQRMFELIREAKQRGKKVVVGGPYVTSATREVLETEPDIVVRGEAENLIDDLLEAIETNSALQVIERSERPDLALSPIPRYDLVNLQDYLVPSIQSSRGCPFDCEFCDVVNLQGRNVRFKSDDQVINELEALFRMGWRGQIFMADDNFIGSKKRSVRLLKRISEWQVSRGKPFCFFGQVSVNLGRDQELIDLMTEARFGDIFVGLESPDVDALEKCGKKQNLGGPLDDAINNLKKSGLLVTGSFIIGVDGEGKGVGKRISELVERTDMPMAQIHTMWAIPNTRLWHRLKQEGRLLENVNPDPMDISDPQFNFITSRPTEEIIEEWRGAWETMYEHSNFLGRAYRCFRAMRPTKKALGISTEPPIPPDAAQWPALPRKYLAEMLGVLRFLWRQGIVSSSRIQFWRQADLIFRKNRSRWKWYMGVCGAGEDMYKVTRLILEGRNRTGSASRTNPGR